MIGRLPQTHICRPVFAGHGIRTYVYECETCGVVLEMRLHRYGYGPDDCNIPECSEDEKQP